MTVGKTFPVERLIRFSQFLVGRVKGGTAYAAIIAAVLFSGISGTAVAATTTTRVGFSATPSDS